MAVYVDQLRSCIPTESWKWMKVSHMFGDTICELTEFAESLGLRPEWIQSDPPHFDLSPKKHFDAIRKGAILMNREGAIIKVRELRDKNYVK